MRIVPLLLLVPALAAAAPKKAPPAKAPAGPEEVNALALVAGAKPLGDDVDGSPLADGSVDTSGSFEPPKQAKTVAVTFRLAEPFDLVRAEAVNAPDEDGYPGISTKKLRLEAARDAGGPWTTLAEPVLQKGAKPQAISFAAAAGIRYVRVTLVENYGNAEWWGLAELRVFGHRTAPRANPAFTGAWQTTYGQMVLTQAGQRVTGCYGGSGKAGDFTVDGVAEGPVFFGTWVERSGGDEANAGRGTFAFALTAEGELAGVWGASAEGNDRTARWDGTVLEKATITCEKPEKQLAEELAGSGRVVLRGILFDTGRDVVRDESFPVLAALAAAMKDGEARYVIEGHTDDRGGEAFNRGLSERRAAMVRTWLMKAGIDGQRLQAKGFGQSRPVMPNDSEAGRAANRRVEVAVVP